MVGATLLTTGQTFAQTPSTPDIGVPGVSNPAGIPPQIQQFLATPPFRGLLPAPQAQPAPRETTGERAVEAARTKLGSAYRYGSAGPDAFDCSGLVQWSYRQAGITLPRTSYGQLDSGRPVPLNQLQPGDLVSFYGGGHSALYEGNGRVIHASTTGSGVVESALSQMPATAARRF
ncbi:C40 family peptidase [Nocardia macrotermitis]